MQQSMKQRSFVFTIFKKTLSLFFEVDPPPLISSQRLYHYIITPSHPRNFRFISSKGELRIFFSEKAHYLTGAAVITIQQ